MQDQWFKLVDPDTPITQGDIIADCPLLDWDSSSLSKGDYGEDPDTLEGMAVAARADVIVMTQACDLEQNSVQKVILCPNYPLDTYKEDWARDMEKQGQTITTKAWKSYCQNVCKGFFYNVAMLNQCAIDEESIEVRIVTFHEVFTLPRLFIENLIKLRGERRFSLLPPYREHLSQAFARYFMRVGLPTNITPVWQSS